MAHLLGGRVEPSAKREYGFAHLEILNRSGLLKGVKDGSQVWMSHGDRVERLAGRLFGHGQTTNARVAVFESRERRLFGVQFHPEVIHTRPGRTVLVEFSFPAGRPDARLEHEIVRRPESR